MIFIEQLVNGWIAWYQAGLEGRQLLIISDKIEGILDYNPLHDFTGTTKKRYGLIIPNITLVIFLK